MVIYMPTRDRLADETKHRGIEGSRNGGKEVGIDRLRLYLKAITNSEYTHFSFPEFLNFIN
jgi:hypothetical protein